MFQFFFLMGWHGAGEWRPRTSWDQVKKKKKVSYNNFNLHRPPSP